MSPHDQSDIAPIVVIGGGPAGLTAAYEILRHGGRTWAESKPGTGATFYFSLPNKRKTPP